MVEKKIYHYDVNTVFKSLKEACSKSSFIINSIDESIRRITISTRLSLFSYGENIEVIVQPEGSNKTLVYVKSEPKVFFNIAAARTIKRNIQRIYRLLDDALG